MDSSLSKSYENWSLSEWLSDLEARNTQEIQLGLTRIKAVAKTLQLQVLQSPVITVAGTNGKGSTVAALESIYHTAGYKVGTYTSPHLVQFNERIRINLTPISDGDLCRAFCIIENARADTMLTYFEMTTLAALWHFKANHLDIVILEVGLGGRLDATNIIDSDLSIITTIDFDHQDYLGDTLEAIGYEKAGILRQGKPFIYADLNPPSTVVKYAAQQSVRAYFFGKEFSLEEGELDWSIQCGSREINHLPKPSIQLKSAAAAITASILLEYCLPVSHESLQEAMRSLFIPGRLQLQTGEVSILYDVSHNPQSVRLLAATLARLAGHAAGGPDLDKKAKIHAVFSALKDKNIIAMIEPLKHHVDYWYPAQLEGKRAASEHLLLTQFQNAGICVKICYNSPLSAFDAALNQAQSGDLIVVYGSFFTVGQIMAAQSNRRFNEISNE
jgi:dihydrofolate synthase / folylpolyglutamate synthase